MSLWKEISYYSGEKRLHKVNKVLFQGQTKYQKVELYDLEHYGVSLILDDEVNICEYDGHIYTELMTHIPLICHPNPKSVCIAGGGDGWILRECLKYNCLEKIDMVELDDALVTRIIQQYTNWYEDIDVKFYNFNFSIIPKGQEKEHTPMIVFGDAHQWLLEHSKEYDVIIMDLTDSIDDSVTEISNSLYKEEFFEFLSENTKEDCIIIMLGGSLKFGGSKVFWNRRQALRSYFKTIEIVPFCLDYFDEQWTFFVVSNGESYHNSWEQQKFDILHWEVEQIDDRIKERINGELKYYDGQLHQTLFTLPKGLR